MGLSQSANAIKNAKLTLQQTLAAGQRNGEVQGLAAGYIDDETSKLDDVFDQLSELSREKAKFGKLSVKSVENLKQVVAQISQEKKALSDKIALAQSNGQITGNTLANLKKSEQALANIESTLQNAAQGLRN